MTQMKWPLILSLMVTLLATLIVCSQVRDIEMRLLNDSHLEDQYEFGLTEDSQFENTRPAVNHLDFNTVIMKIFIPGLAWASLLAISSYLAVSILSTHDGRMFVFVGLSGYALLCVSVLIVVVCLEKVGMIPADDQI